jgi:hypothetical protein
VTDEDISIFSILGWDMHPEGTELLGECVFCGKEKMYLNPRTSKFHCKVCGKGGNSATVLKSMHDYVYRPALTPERLNTLATYRGVPESHFSLDDNLGYDPFFKRFMWLSCSPDGKVAGFRTLRSPKPGKKESILQLKGTHLGLVGGQDVLGEKGTIYICEGEWDRISFMNLLQEMELPGTVVAVPGCNNFPKEWPPLLRGKDLVFLYDNDKPGRDGHNAVYKKVKSYAKQVGFIHWDSSKSKEGYDIDDLVKDNISRLSDAWRYVTSNLRPVPEHYVPETASKDSKEAEQAGVTPITVEDLHGVFRDKLQLKNTDLLDVMMGAMWAVHIPGDPLWLLLVAPPAGGKTETIMPASAWWRCVQMSTITSKALVSGYKMAGGQDPSLLAQLEGKRAILMVKDLTPMLQAHGEEREEVFAILRDAYDGSITKFFGNSNEPKSYTNLHFSIIAGVTPVIDSFDNTAMGERFLKFRSERNTGRYDDVDKARRAILNSGSEDDIRADLRNACVSALQRPFLEENIPTPTIDFVDIITKISVVVAYARAVAPVKEGTSQQTMEPVIEVPTRIAKQLTKMAKGLALHFECKDLMDERILTLVKRVALHTPESMSVRVIMELFKGPVTGTLIGEIVRHSPSMTGETVTFILTRMRMLGYVYTKPNPHGDAKFGQTHLYFLTDDFRRIITSSTIFELPDHDIFTKEINEPQTLS